MRSRTLWTSILFLFALYVPSVLLIEATYDPNDGGPPASAGVRVRLIPPYESLTPIAATKRDQLGIFERMDLATIELWEGNRKLGPGNSTVNEIASLGNGRFLLERGPVVTWSSSDNTDPMTNGRTYWVVNPQ
jgi:hypothetical protein